MPIPRDRRARLAAFVVFAVQGLTFATLLTQVAVLQKNHGLTDGGLAVLLLVAPVIAGVGSVLAGALAARFGSRRVLRLAQPFACAAVVLAGIAADVPTLVAAITAFGLGLGGVDAGMNMQGVAVERRYGRPVLTGFHALWSLAAVVGALWASAAADTGLRLATTFAIALVPAAAASIAAAAWLYGPAEEHTRAAGASPDAPTAKSAARVPWKPVIPLCLAMAFLYVGDSSISNFGSVFMEKVTHAPAGVVPMALGAYQATTFLVRVCGDFAVRRYGPAAIVRIGAVIATLGFAAIVTAPAELWAIGGFALTGIGLSVIAPQSFSAAGRLDPDGSGVAVARVNMFNYVGFIVGAALVGGIADASDYRIAFAAPLALTAVIIMLARGFQPVSPAASRTRVPPT
ncbi:MFS transporter [Sphaerimonospora thailandensis]|uniref:MFS transporter n=1 Tax=Sphaerimonospora thailandensis TaxID=795644 RepID=A0A8J3R8A6_9ACTN|nr:MFS transporter [Sphaerimonospora thailandensis]GIH69207.1 MFS transporter [Sphaerimonospora thailandensis]